MLQRREEKCFGSSEEGGMECEPFGETSSHPFQGP